MVDQNGTVMLTLDGSEFAEQAIGRACEVASAYGSGLVLLEVLPDHHGPSPFSIEGARRSDRRRAARHLRQAKQRLVDEGIREVETLTVENASPARAIVESAEQMKCGAVVMATHGRQGLSRVLYGSVAEYVVHHLVDIPVVLVHGEAA